jgi:4-hydroxy-2-oxoglutarate aldolase
MASNVKRKQVTTHLTGIYAPVVTPFTRRGDVDERLYRENLLRYAGTGLAGIVVAGSTGEAPFLTGPERLRLTEITRRVLRPPQLLIVGTGFESTRETVQLSREAFERGADAVLAVTPSYYKARMDSKALVAHFRSLADRLRRPVIMYNIPQFTGVRMSPDAIGMLSRHPNIVGLKESSGDLAYLRAILRRVRPGFRVLVGSALILYDALRAGAAGAVLSQAGFVPELCVDAYDAVRQRRLKAARDLQQRLAILASRIAIPYGVAGLKEAYEICGYAGGKPRLPLLPLTAAARRIVAATVREARAGLEF